MCLWPLCFSSYPPTMYWTMWVGGGIKSCASAQHCDQWPISWFSSSELTGERSLSFGRLAAPQLALTIIILSCPPTVSPSGVYMRRLFPLRIDGSDISRTFNLPVKNWQRNFQSPKTFVGHIPCLATARPALSQVIAMRRDLIAVMSGNSLAPSR